jgi:hypothetical protein
MSRFSVLAGFAVTLLGGCTPGSEQDGDTKIPVQPEKTKALSSPTHIALDGWAFPDSVAVVGQGACAGTTLSGFLDSVRRDFPAVSDIVELRSTGPRGVTLNAGPSMPAGVPIGEPTGQSAFVVAFMDAQSFGAAFYRGDRCRGDSCEILENRYFESDSQCRPRWVGHYRKKLTEGPRGRCTEETGQALWNHPPMAQPLARCDADWSPQNVSGQRQIAILNAPGDGECGRKVQAPFTVVDVVVAQNDDLANAKVTFWSTGLPFLDGKAFSAKVERQHIKATFVERLPGSCEIERQYDIDLNFEGAQIGIPNGLGLLDVFQRAVGQCEPAQAPCKESMHLMRL